LLGRLQEQLNKYFTASFVILGLFLLTAIIVSPKGVFNYATNTPIGKADYSVFLNINNSHYPALNEIMIWLTEFGREVFWPITIILLFVLGGWTGKKTAAVIAISMLVLIPLGEIAKDSVARPRPVIPQSDFLISADKDYAFPSGHAVIVSSGATGALMLFRGTSRRVVVSTIFAIEAALVCLSRIYVGGHYPLDVIGGILLGVGVSLILVGVEKHIESLFMPLKKLLRR
jgi:undecaprenyl-diphosphatase